MDCWCCSVVRGAYTPRRITPPGCRGVAPASRLPTHADVDVTSGWVVVARGLRFGSRKVAEERAGDHRGRPFGRLCGWCGWPPAPGSIVPRGTDSQTALGSPAIDICASRNKSARHSCAQLPHPSQFPDLSQFPTRANSTTSASCRLSQSSAMSPRTVGTPWDNGTGGRRPRPCPAPAGPCPCPAPAGPRPCPAPTGPRSVTQPDRDSPHPAAQPHLGPTTQPDLAPPPTTETPQSPRPTGPCGLSRTGDQPFDRTATSRSDVPTGAQHQPSRTLIAPDARSP